jgi:hypothetical protein
MRNGSVFPNLNTAGLLERQRKTTGSLSRSVPSALNNLPPQRVRSDSQQFLAAANMSTTIFWNGTPCSLVGVYRGVGTISIFRVENYCEQARARAEILPLSTSLQLLFLSAYCAFCMLALLTSTLQMETIGSFETPVYCYEFARNYISEDLALHNHRCEKFQYHKVIFVPVGYRTSFLEDNKYWYTYISNIKSIKRYSVVSVVEETDKTLYRAFTSRSFWNDSVKLVNPLKHSGNYTHHLF